VHFEQQRDPASIEMAAVQGRDWDAFLAHWEKNLADPTVVLLTILFDGQVAGSVVSWVNDEGRNVGYRIGREYWGKGIATRALRALLSPDGAASGSAMPATRALTERVRLLETRPLVAHVAKHNTASLRVLQKCGFAIASEGTFPFGAPGEVVEEFVLTLEAPR
jgi:RimJ/RimL family protein N-acetyltransferase